MPDEPGTELDDAVASLADKLQAIELTAKERRVLAAALGGTAAEVEGYGYDLNPNDLAIRLASSLGFRPVRPSTSDADIGPIL